jgi:hypothetical protein
MAAYSRLWITFLTAWLHISFPWISMARGGLWRRLGGLPQTRHDGSYQHTGPIIYPSLNCWAALYTTYIPMSHNGSWTQYFIALRQAGSCSYISTDPAGRSLLANWPIIYIPLITEWLGSPIYHIYTHVPYCVLNPIFHRSTTKLVLAPIYPLTSHDGPYQHIGPITYTHL